MKRRYSSIVLAAILGSMLLGGCGTGTTKTTETSYAGETISGQVSEVGENTIKMEVDNSEEETTITVDDDTEITKQSAGGPGGAPPGEAPSDGESTQTPPEKPEGADSTSDSTSQESGESGDSQDGDTSQTPPEKPEGDNNASGTDSEKNEEISINDISEGDNISVTFADDGTVESIVVLSGMNGDPGGNSGGVESYDAVEDITEDTEKSDETVESTGTDENAIHVSEGANAVLKNDTINRTSSDSKGGDDSSFYGVGAALLTTDGTTYVADSKITTQQDTAGGIHAAGGGTLYAWNLDVETSGESSAAIRSDRGGGTMVVDGGSYTSNGKGSPAIYSTADIAVNDAQLTANGSEAICIEGLNSIHLFDSDLTGNMSDD